MKRRIIMSLSSGLLLIALFNHNLLMQADTLRLDIAHTNSNVVLTWTNAGVALENSLVLTGAWNEVTGDRKSVV